MPRDLLAEASQPRDLLQERGIPPVDPRSGIEEIGTSLKAGFVSELPQATGRAIQYFAPEAEVGRNIEEFGIRQGQRLDLQPSPDIEERPILKAVSDVARSLPQTLVPVAAAGAATAMGAGAPITVPLAGAAALGLFGGSSAEETRRRVKETTGSDEAADAAARKTLAVQGTGDMVLSMLGGKLIGAFGKSIAGSGARTAKDVLQKVANPEHLKRFGKDFGTMLAVEPVTEAAQDVGQELIERQAGAPATAPLGEIAKSSAIGGGIMATFFGALGIPVRASQARSQTRLLNALSDPTAAVDRRTAAALAVGDQIEKVDPELAKNWRENAAVAIDNALAVELNESFLRPVEELNERIQGFKLQGGVYSPYQSTMPVSDQPLLPGGEDQAAWGQADRGPDGPDGTGPAALPGGRPALPGPEGGVDASYGPGSPGYSIQGITDRPQSQLEDRAISIFPGIADLPVTRAILRSKGKGRIPALPALSPASIREPRPAFTPTEKVAVSRGTLPDNVQEIQENQPEETQSTTFLNDEQFPVREIPVAFIQQSPDVQNFKADADEKTGVVSGQELQGKKYKRLGTGPIVVWQRVNGRMEIITGRHRLNLAKRTGETTIPAQIVRESEGFTREMALTFDAEANIIDGQGSTQDYARYFKGKTKVTREEAEGRGLLSRAKGRAGYDLGRHAADEVYDLWRNGQINEDQALAIVRAAPDDQKAQEVGARYARDGKPAHFVSNMVKVALLGSQRGEANLDLFGNDDSALKDAEDQAKRASSFQREIKDQIAAVSGASKRPEAARKLGVDVKDPAAVRAKIAELKAEAVRWENWPAHADLVAKVRGEEAPLVDQDISKENKSVTTESPETPPVSSTEQEGLAFSKEGAQGTVSLRDATYELERLLIKNLGLKKENIRLLTTEAELPKHIQDAMKSLGYSGIEGVYDRKTKKVYIVASNLGSVERLQEVLRHELTHKGLRNILGDRITPIFEQIAQEYASEIEQIGRDYGIDISTDEGRMDAVDELIAQQAENMTIDRNIIQRIVAAVRQFLRDIGFTIKFSDNDILSMAGSAMRAEGMAGEGVAFSLKDRFRHILRPDEKLKLKDSDDLAAHLKAYKKSELWEGIKKGTDRIVGIISTRLKNINPVIKDAARKYVFAVGRQTSKDSVAAYGFVDKFSKLDDETKINLSRALLNGDAATADSIAAKHNMTADMSRARQIFEETRQRANEAGYDVDKIDNYWARVVKDPEGLLNDLRGTEEYSAIDAAILAKERAQGFPLTDVEKAQIADLIMRGYPAGSLPLSGTSHMKERKFKTVPDKYLKYYMSADQSIISYIRSMNNAIEAAKFFGKGKAAQKDLALGLKLGIITEGDLEKSIGSYIIDLKNKGLLKGRDELPLKEMLSAVFKPARTGAGVQMYKNLTYLQLLTQFTPAITQIMDLALTAEQAGYWNTLKVLGKTIIGKSDIKLADIGLEQIMEEFEGGTDAIANALSKAMKVTGFTAIDRIGKETLLNGKLVQFRQQAGRNDPKLRSEIERIFGAEFVDTVMSDLKAARKTDDTLFLLYNKLSDVQPISRIEVPEAYLKSGAGKVFYALKTYQLKLMDVYRNEVWHEIKNGNKVEGFRKLAMLTGALVVLGAGTDEIKDWMLGRKTSFDDKVIDNLLRLGGFSKYTISRSREQGIGSALLAQFAPPFGVIDPLTKDIDELVRKGELEKGARSTAYVPVVGKMYYWWLGRGTKIKAADEDTRAKQEQERKRLGDKRYEQKKEMAKLREQALRRLRTAKTADDIRAARQNIMKFNYDLRSSEAFGVVDIISADTLSRSRTAGLS